jgi:hypothetical protein
MYPIAVHVGYLEHDIDKTGFGCVYQVFCQHVAGGGIVASSFVAIVIAGILIIGGIFILFATKHKNGQQDYAEIL